MPRTLAFSLSSASLLNTSLTSFSAYAGEPPTFTMRTTRGLTNRTTISRCLGPRRAAETVAIVEWRGRMSEGWLRTEAGTVKLEDVLRRREVGWKGLDEDELDSSSSEEEGFGAYGKWDPDADVRDKRPSVFTGPSGTSYQWTVSSSTLYCHTLSPSPRLAAAFHLSHSPLSSSFTPTPTPPAAFTLLASHIADLDALLITCLLFQLSLQSPGSVSKGLALTDERRGRRRSTRMMKAVAEMVWGRSEGDGWEYEEVGREKKTQ